MSFFKFYNKSMRWIFLIFFMKLQQHEAYKLGEIFYDKVFSFGVLNYVS